jgi:hypothetical protein
MILFTLSVPEASPVFSSCYLLCFGFLLGLYFDSEDAYMSLRNVAWLSMDYNRYIPDYRNFVWIIFTKNIYLYSKEYSILWTVKFTLTPVGSE